MKKNIMKKLAKLEGKCGGKNFLALQGNTEKAFKIKHLERFIKRCGSVEALRKTCFPTLPQRLIKVN